jgi:hypothetical protein
MRSGGRDFLRLCGVAIVVGGLAAALTLLFIPLSVQRASSGQVIGWCGPGFHSANALQVRIDPGIVNTGGGSGPSVPAAQQRKFEQFCTHQADGQLIEAAVITVLALLIGLPMVAARRRQDEMPASPGAGPPSLSSSGTPGNTVWK